jgi:hypothetical protein
MGEIGVTEVWVMSNAIGDRYLFDPVPQMVVGVLNPAEGSGESLREALTNFDVAIRLGRAVERRVPVLLIVPPPLPVPAQSTGMTIAPCPADHEASLRLHVWAFKGQLTDKDAVDSVGRKIETMNFDSILDEITGSSSRGALEFEQLVASVLQQAGAVTVSSEDPSADDGVDMALVTPDEPSTVILAQVKYGRLTREQIQRAERRLEENVRLRNAGLGLLIYQDQGGREFPATHPSPLVARLPFEEFVRSLSSSSLNKVISDAFAQA